MLKRLSIKYQLGIVAGTMVLAIIGMAFLQYISIQQVSSLKDARILNNEIETQLLKLQMGEYDPLAFNYSKTQQTLVQHAEQLQLLLATHDIDYSLAIQLRDSLKTEEIVLPESPDELLVILLAKTINESLLISCLIFRSQIQGCWTSTPPFVVMTDHLSYKKSVEPLLFLFEHAFHFKEEYFLIRYHEFTRGFF